MKWIKGFLVFGMVMLAHSTVSINTVEANPKTEHVAKKGKPAKAKKAKTAKNNKHKKAKTAKSEKSKKGGLFSSFTSGLKKAGSKIASGAKAVGSKIASGAKAVKDKAGNAVACRSGAGEAPGKKLFAMAAAGTPLADAHVVAAHTSASKTGRKK
jgi:hypothetical protein